MITVSKKVDSQKMNTCKYCSKTFSKISTFSTHMCVKKRRMMDINATGPRLGFRAFQRFYELTTNSKHPKTAEEFISSQYYTDFARFGNYLTDLRPIHIEQFIDFLIKNSIKLKDWTKEPIYHIYLDDFLKKEPAVSAVERSIKEIMCWCEKNSVEFYNFFASIHPNEAALMIRAGKISPWILYLGTTADTLMSKFNEDHEKMIGSIIDPGFWSKKFKKNTDDVEYIQSILEQAGI
jgi:hypothetical protein